MKPVYLVELKRSPQVKAGMDLKDIPVPYLASYLVRNILDGASLPPEAIDEVIFGNVGAPAKYPNISRVIALEAGLPLSVSAYSVHRNCASGMEALSEAFLKVGVGRSDLIIAGGVESMSQMPLIYNKEMTELFVNLMKAKSIPDKLKALTAFRPNFLTPIVAIEQGLTDPFCGLNMGQTADLLARELGITREEQDEYANNSHLKASKAIEEGRFLNEIVPMMVGEKSNKLLKHDVGPRSNSTVEGLAKMRPYFEKKSGSVTVGNSCPITDGASAILVASEEAVKKYNLKPMVRMVDYHFAGLDPKRMGMGPMVAMDGLLKRTQMSINEMDLVEINEAFSAQVLAVLRGMKDKSVANKFGVSAPVGEIPLEKLNVNGGAVALGHPVGSTGSRLIVTLAHALSARNLKRGIASLCIGGGQGGAVIIERV